MNERIRELAEQAGFNQMGIYNIIGIEEYHQKFAELIVRECAELVEDGIVEQQVGDENTYTSVSAADIILEHFGVES